MLPRTWRLMSTKEFSAVYRRGRRISTPSATVFYLRQSNSNQHTKIAVVTSAKVSKSAVKRNAARRRTWVVLRNFLPVIPESGWYIVLVLKASALTKSVQQLTTEFTPLRACVSSR